MTHKKFAVTVLGEKEPRYTPRTPSVAAKRMLELRAAGFPAFMERIQ